MSRIHNQNPDDPEAVIDAWFDYEQPEETEAS